MGTSDEIVGSNKFSIDDIKTNFVYRFYHYFFYKILNLCIIKFFLIVSIKTIFGFQFMVHMLIILTTNLVKP